MNDLNGFGSSESQEEYCATIKHRLLTQSWIQFDQKYGISISDLIGEDDPTAFIWQLKEVGRSLQDSAPLSVRVVDT